MVTIRIDDPETLELLEKLYTSLEDACESYSKRTELIGKILEKLAKIYGDKRSLEMTSIIASALGELCSEMKKRNVKRAAPVKFAILITSILLETGKGSEKKTEKQEASRSG